MTCPHLLFILSGRTMSGKKPPAPLSTPHPAATPAGPRPTPVAPEHFRRADLIQHRLCKTAPSR